jgi:hypothetical protein
MDSRPPSPAVLTLARMSRKGRARVAPLRTIRMRPARSVTNWRVSPGGAVRKVGALRPLRYGASVRPIVTGCGGLGPLTGGVVPPLLPPLPPPPPPQAPSTAAATDSDTQRATERQEN